MLGAILWADRHKKYFFIFYRNTSKCIKITNFTHVLPLQYNSDQHPWILRGNPALTDTMRSGAVAGCFTQYLQYQHNIYNLPSTAGAGAWSPWTRPDQTRTGSPAPVPPKLCEYIQNCAWKFPAQQQFCPETPHTAPSSGCESECRCDEPKPRRT